MIWSLEISDVLDIFLQDQVEFNANMLEYKLHCNKKHKTNKWTGLNRREKDRVPIPSFANIFSEVMYIANALSTPVLYQFYDTRFLVREAST